MNNIETLKDWDNEIQKCKKNPYYFIKTYTNIQLPITIDNEDAFNEYYKTIKNYSPLKFRNKTFNPK